MKGYLDIALETLHSIEEFEDVMEIWDWHRGQG